MVRPNVEAPPRNWDTTRRSCKAQPDQPPDEHLSRRPASLPGDTVRSTCTPYASTNNEGRNIPSGAKAILTAHAGASMCFRQTRPTTTNQLSRISFAPQANGHKVKPLASIIAAKCHRPLTNSEGRAASMTTELSRSSLFWLCQHESLDPDFRYGAVVLATY